MMDEIGKLFTIAIGVILVNNYVLARFLGLCPFVGVSKKTETALGMGQAVIFVMTIASVATWLIYNYLLMPGAQNIIGWVFPVVATTGLVEVLKTVSYILVIAALVQLVEMVMRKSVPNLYQALGIYLPLITTNCAVLGVALLNTTDAPQPLNVLEAAVQGFCAGLGFTLALLLMSGIRERLDYVNVPKPLRGAPITFICAGFMGLAFMGFSGMVK